MTDVLVDEAAVDAVLTASRTLVAIATQSLGAAAEETTIAQYRALVVLASRGPQRMVDLATALGVTPSTAGRMSDRLLRKGLIRRHRARADRREVQVSITAAGRDVVDQATARRRALLAEILVRLSLTEQAALAQALRAFTVAAGEVPDSDWPADVVAIPFLGGRPFLAGSPSGIGLAHPADYLLIAALAVAAGLIGVLFKNVLYKMEDLWDVAWKDRPEWAPPAVGGLALGLVILALPQLYGVGYPVMDKAVAGSYALWFLLILSAGKIIAASTTLGMGGSGGVFAPSLFVGATAGMAFGELATHVFGPTAGQPALYAVVAMGAVFTSAARAPLTSVASVVELTGDYTLTLPVMLAVGIATANIARTELRHHLHDQAAAVRPGRRPLGTVAGIR